MDTWILEMQRADVAVVGNHIDIKMGIRLFEQGIDDRGKESDLAVSGNDHPEMIVLFEGVRVDGEHEDIPILSDEKFPGPVDQQQYERLDQKRGQKSLDDKVQNPQNQSGQIDVQSF